MLRTLMIVTVGRMFPKAASFGVAISMYGSILKGNGGISFTEQILDLGLTARDFIVLLVACAIWFVVSLFEERGTDVRMKLGEINIVLRWVILFGILLIIAIVGVYGPGYDQSAFIYRGF